MKDFFFGYNSVSWSISTELGFYLLFPLLLYRFQETWHFKLAAALLLAILLIVLCVQLDLPPYSDTYTGATYFGFVHIDPLARLLYHGIETPARWIIVSAADRRTQSIKRQVAKHALQLSTDS